MGRGIFSDDHIRALLSAAPAAARLPISAPAASIARPPDYQDNASMRADSQKFLAAWFSWRSGDLIPRRSQVDLASIARLMPQLHVLEVPAPDRGTFRLVGSEVEDLFGTRLGGRSFIKSAEPAEQKRRSDFLWRQVSHPCAAVIWQTLEFRSGRRITIEAAAAPVRPDADDQPMQVFAVACGLPRMPLQTDGPRDIVVRNFSHNLRFIDIGAGLPEIV